MSTFGLFVMVAGVLLIYWTLGKDVFPAANTPPNRQPPNTTA